MGVGLLLFFAVAPGSNAAPTTEPSSPTLGVTIDNGVGSVAGGDTLTYVITVQNLGTSVLNDLVVTQSLSQALEYVVADPGGVAQPGSVSWSLDLSANETATFRTTTSVTNTPPDREPVASKVCVATAVDVPPTICATDSDQLTGGAASETADATQVAAPEVDGAPWWSLSAALGLVTVIAVVAVFLIRRRQKQ